MMSGVRSVFLVLLNVLFLAGCGGGSGGPAPTPEPPAPVAIGKAQSANEGTTPIRQEEAFMYLDASASYDPSGHTLTFAWSLDERPAGSVRQLERVSTNSLPEIPHPKMRLDPDLPGEYTATLVVSNGTTQTSVKVPFTVVPDPPWFWPGEIQLFQPNVNESSIYFYDRWAVKIRPVSNYPYTAEVFFNDVSQGFLSADNYIQYEAPYRGGGAAYLLPITGYPGGEYTVKLVMRAGGQSAEFTGQLTFPACSTPDAPTYRTCPPS
jgi:hypothetical protein